MNEEAKNISRKFLAEGNYVGKKCYEVLHGQKVVCSFARISCFPRRVSY